MTVSPNPAGSVGRVLHCLCNCKAEGSIPVNAECGNMWYADIKYLHGHGEELPETASAAEKNPERCDMRNVKEMLSMKKMSMRAKRWAILGVFMAVAAIGWTFLGDFADEWLIIVFLVGTMTEWKMIRCPMCGRHMAWTDKDICAICVAEIAASEEENRGKPY